MTDEDRQQAALAAITALAERQQAALATFADAARVWLTALLYAFYQAQGAPYGADAAGFARWQAAQRTPRRARRRRHR